MQTLLRCLDTPHVESQAFTSVRARVWWIMETLKHLAIACTVGWVAQLSQLASPGEGKLNFPWEKAQWDNTVVQYKSQVKKMAASVCNVRSYICDAISIFVICVASSDVVLFVLICGNVYS